MTLNEEQHKALTLILGYPVDIWEEKFAEEMWPEHPDKEKAISLLQELRGMKLANAVSRGGKLCHYVTVAGKQALNSPQKERKAA